MCVYILHHFEQNFHIFFSFLFTRESLTKKKCQKTLKHKTKTHKHGDFSGDLSGPIEAVVSFRCVARVRVSLALSIVSLSLSLSLSGSFSRAIWKKMHLLCLFLDIMEIQSARCFCVNENAPARARGVWKEGEK